MHLFLSGCHGVGKTTVVNNLKVDKPLLKYIDVDMLPFTGTGFKQQQTRYDIMYGILKTMPQQFNTIVDRSPFDFYVYNAIVCEDTQEMNVLNQQFLDLLGAYNSIGGFTILITDTWEHVWDRIQNRSRDGLEEMNEEFSKRVWNHFNRIINTFPDIIPKRFEEVDDYIHSLFI